MANRVNIRASITDTVLAFSSATYTLSEAAPAEPAQPTARVKVVPAIQRHHLIVVPLFFASCEHLPRRQAPAERDEDGRAKRPVPAGVTPPLPGSRMTTFRPGRGRDRSQGRSERRRDLRDDAQGVLERPSALCLDPEAHQDRIGLPPEQDLAHQRQTIAIIVAVDTPAELTPVHHRQRPPLPVADYGRQPHRCRAVQDHWNGDPVDPAGVRLREDAVDGAPPLRIVLAREECDRDPDDLARAPVGPPNSRLLVRIDGKRPLGSPCRGRPPRDLRG